MKKLDEIIIAVRKCVSLRQTSYSNFSADIRTAEEREAKVPREIIVGLAELRQVPRSEVMAVLNIEGEAEWNNHWKSFQERVATSVRERKSGEIWDRGFNGKEYRFYLKLSLVLNRLLLNADWGEDPLFTS